MATLLDIIEPVENISLWAMDETGNRLESNNFYSWSLVGKPTVIERNGSHRGLNIIGATEILKHYSPELNPQENMWNWLKSFVSQASALASEPGAYE